MLFISSFFFFLHLVNDDLDGQPLEDVLPLKEPQDVSSKFKPSKWETVDPETVEAQGIFIYF